METEIWKPVVGFEGKYEISNLGKIKSLNFHREGIEKLLFIHNYNGYGGIKLCNNGIITKYIVSRLVANHFIPNPENKPFACHKVETLDERGMFYNGADNLYWGTHSDNMKDMYKKGRDNNILKLRHPMKGRFGKDHPSSKKVIQYTKDGIFIKEWDSLKNIQDVLKIHSTNIAICCYGKKGRKTAGGFIWKFK